MAFENRRDAGLRLAPLLMSFAEERPIVLALPRGGVPVAIEVAHALGAPLDLLAVRKLGVPGNPEFALGALAEDGTAVVDQALARHLGITQEELDRIAEREATELRRQIERFRDGRPRLDVRDRTVIVVDDGLATGLTDLAAVRALRRRGADRIVVAAPVGSREAVAILGDAADQVVCHTMPSDLGGVGRWYRDFSQVSDGEVLALLAEAGVPASPDAGPQERDGGGELVIDLSGVCLRGDLVIPPDARGLVLFAHGSGSSRLSPRNRMVARRLEEAGLATLLFDLLVEDEEGRRDLVFDIPLLAGRLAGVARWVHRNSATLGLPLGYFGASTGAAAALWAAAAQGDVGAIVSRGGRPDLAADRLSEVRAPTLLIVGSRDPEVLELNRRAAGLLRCPHRVEVVKGAGHLFEEPGTLEAVAELAIGWFQEHLAAAPIPVAHATET